MLAAKPSCAAEFHCWYAATRDEALEKGRYLRTIYNRYLNAMPLVDLGCGEGAFLLAMMEAGRSDVVGVECNPQLIGLARSFGVPVVESDILEYFRSAERRPATYIYLDVVEHVPFDFNLELFQRIPAGSRLLLQTPNTTSLLGHSFYMQVPSHVAPYSPWVLEKTLLRLGYTIRAKGSLDLLNRGTWKNRLRAFFIRKVLGVDPNLLLGGGNFFLVADRITNGSAEVTPASCRL